MPDEDLTLAIKDLNQSIRELTKAVKALDKTRQPDKITMDNGSTIQFTAEPKQQLKGFYD
jgi:hypothetical protein